MSNVLLLLMILLSACALVGLDVAMRPAHYLRPGAGGLSLSLNSLSRQLLPRLATSTAYRIIGLASALLALGLALLTYYYAATDLFTR